MSRNAPVLYLSVERKKNLGNFESETVTMGVSGLPFDATEEMIAQALATGEYTVEKLRGEVRDIISGIRREVDHSAFHHEDEEKWGLEIAQPLVDRIAIPAEEEVPTPQFCDAWHDEPITDGQLVALNAGLSTIGITGTARHRACESLLGWALGGCKSTKDLSKADAHIVLEWISEATAKECEQLKSYATQNPRLAGVAL